MMQLPNDKYCRYDDISIASLPRDKKGYLDEKEIYTFCGKAHLPLESLYDMYPHEFIFYIEGYLEDQREYFEFMNYSLFSSIRQALGKGKNFSNPFEKAKEEAHSVKLTEEEYNAEIEAIKSMFNL